jgi:hypothetical protein
LYNPLISTKIGCTFMLVGSCKVFEVSHVYKFYLDWVFFKADPKGSIEEEQG